MEIPALVALFVLFAAMACCSGDPGRGLARDAHHDAGIEFPSKYASGLAGSWRAYGSRSKVLTVEGTLVRLHGKQVLIEGPDEFGRLRQRWFTLASGVSVPQDIRQGAWIQMQHSGCVLITIAPDRSSPHEEDL